MNGGSALSAYEASSVIPDHKSIVSPPRVSLGNRSAFRSQFRMSSTIQLIHLHKREDLLTLSPSAMRALLGPAFSGGLAIPLTGRFELPVLLDC